MKEIRKGVVIGGKDSECMLPASKLEIFINSFFF